MNNEYAKLAFVSVVAACNLTAGVLSTVKIVKYLRAR